MHLPREKIDPEQDSIGNVWTDRQRKARLFCSAFVPTDSFYSLCDAMGRNEFTELVVEFRNLDHGRGSTSQVSFRAHLTDLSDED